MYYVGVVTEAHDATILEIGCEEVFWPKVSIFRPGLLSMTPQAVNEDNTRFRGGQQSVATSLGMWTYSTSGFSAICNVDRPYFDISVYHYTKRLILVGIQPDVYGQARR